MAKKSDNSTDAFLEDGVLVPPVAQNTGIAGVRSLTDVYAEHAVNGTKIDAKDLLDHEFVITSLKEFTGEFGRAYFAVIADEFGQVFNTVLGGVVIMEQLDVVKGELPLRVTLRKTAGGQFGGYYTFE